MSKTKKTEKSKLLQGQALEALEIGGAVYKTRLTSKFRNRKPWIRPDEKKLTALIPGTIQKLFVKEGDVVEPGSPLLILEAMKMRNEIRTSIDGVVKKINVQEGEHVRKDYLLIEFS